MLPVRYITRRLLSYILTIFVSATLIFVLPRVAAGNPIENILIRMELQGTSISGGKEMIDAWVQRFGLDKDLWTQYTLWLGNLFRGDFGLSMIWFPASVQDILKNALPWTIGFSIMVILLGWVIGNIFGALVGWRGEHSRFNWVFASVSIVINHIPFYVLGLLLIMVFTFYLQIFPSSGGTNYMITYQGISPALIVDILYHATLPALSVILVSIGGYLITMRSLMVNIKGEDFVRYAQARGLKKGRIMMNYAFRNALLPQVTGLALSLGSIASGSMIVEWIFSYPGIGSLYVKAIGQNDYNVVQAITLLVIFGVMTGALLIDLLYPILDPRISYEKR